MLSLPSMRTGILAKKSLGQIPVKRDSKISRVSFPEENRLQLCFDRRKIPVFTDNIRQVLSTSHVKEAGDASSNCFMGAVVRECIVVLVELGMRNRSSVDNQFIISKHHGVSIKNVKAS